MNETETRAELIDHKLKSCSWGVVDGSRILRECNVCKITDGRILHLFPLKIRVALGNCVIIRKLQSKTRLRPLPKIRIEYF